MNLVSAPLGMAGASTPAARDDVLWHHGVLCGLALPLRSTKEPWSRHASGSSITIEPNAADGAVPSGRSLRLALLRICDTAVRTRVPAVELGDGPSAWATALGIEPSGTELRDLATGLERLAACRMTVSIERGPTLPVFDARSRPRAGAGGPVSSVRLNGRFLESLFEEAVPLSRSAISALWQTPQVLDAYAWAAQQIHRAGGEADVVGWDELGRRFGAPSRDAGAFRISFDEALRAAVAADPTIAIAVTEAGVQVRPAPSGVSVSLPEPSGFAGTDPAVGEPEAPGPIVPVVASPDAAHAATPGAEAGPSAPSGVAVEAVPLPARSDLPDPVSLAARQTGVPGVIWLRQGHGEPFPLVGITPGARLDPARLTVLTVEPMVLQVEGGLPERDFARVSAWIMANRDLIDDVWEGRIGSVEELDAKVQMLRPPAWR